ncbi:MAG: hypothetical protein HXY28_07850 [Hydrogenophilaceae bacterium]|nr:hypothetical protein [Hydrogenophilaceae bacterium]
MTGVALFEEVNQRDGANRVFAFELQADGEFTRRIRRMQFCFAICVLSFFLLGLGGIVALGVWDSFWGLPGARECGAYIVSLLDWAKALINTLFGAALGLALGSLYASGRRN